MKMVDEQSVIVRAAVTGDDDVLAEATRELECQLSNAVEAAGAGEFDESELGQGELVLFMYGGDADRLFTSVASILRGCPLTRSAVVTIRKGPPGSPQ
jgi:hypothetical protein